jgi:hypothetical protein
MNMKLHAPVIFMAIGMGAEFGFMLVPDAWFIR